MCNITPDINNFVKRTLVTTADENYILARHAFFMGFYNDFFWLSLHSIEKYLKAVLLINGHSSKNYGHDIVKLYNTVKDKITCINIDGFTNPLPETDMYWRDESIENFLTRLNEYGSADNRYMLYGYNQQQTDIFKADHLVWQIRWYCKSRFINLKTKTIDTYIEPKTANNWKHIGSNLPLEKSVQSEEADSLFFKFNYSFAPEIDHAPRRWQFSSKNPPLADYATRIKSSTATEETKEHSKDFLIWVLENYQLNKSDKKTIQELAGVSESEGKWGEWTKSFRPILKLINKHTSNLLKKIPK